MLQHWFAAHLFLFEATSCDSCSTHTFDWGWGWGSVPSCCRRSCLLTYPCSLEPRSASLAVGGCSSSASGATTDQVVGGLWTGHSPGNMASFQAPPGHISQAEVLILSQMAGLQLTVNAPDADVKVCAQLVCLWAALTHSSTS